MHPYVMQETAGQREGTCAGQHGNTARLGPAAAAW
jgi:hypothetical protein